MGKKDGRPSRDALHGQIARVRAVVDKANFLVDVRDARIPWSSASAGIFSPSRKVPMAVILNKADLADPGLTGTWKRALEEEGHLVALTSATQAGKSRKTVLRLLERAQKEVRSALGVLRVALVGFPNVGKSSIINRVLKIHRTHVGDRPGVTKGEQWVNLFPGCYLLDTPGVIHLYDRVRQVSPWRFDRLAWCRLVPEGAYDPVDLVERFCAYAALRGGLSLAGAYAKLDPDWADPRLTLERVAERFGMRSQGGDCNLHAAAVRFMSDLVGGRLGRLTLERPNEVTKQGHEAPQE